MKNLKITYGDAVLWDAPVGSLEWHDSENGVRVDGRINAGRPVSPGPHRSSGILDVLTKASRAKTMQMAEEKREAYGAETVEPELEDSA